MGPPTQADGHDAPRLIDEAVPGVAAVIDDVVVGREDAVGEPIIAHELPHVLDRIEFGTFGRQRQEGDIGRNVQFAGHVPSSLIQHKHGVSAGCDLATDFGKVHIHCFAVATRHDQCGAFTFCGTDRPKDPGRSSTQIARRDRSGSTPGPAPGELRLLANPGFILPPELYRRAFGQTPPDLRQAGREGFLKAAISSGRCP